LISEQKALERGFHGAWRPPLRGGIQHDGWPWGAERRRAARRRRRPRPPRSARRPCGGRSRAMR
jgi:hypothetical protein